ncbi:MAG: hypothetical protein WBM29_12960 [Candidatus Deferrimicrobium sp.]
MERIMATIAAATLFCFVLIGAGGDVLAGHPFVTEDAGTQGKGNVEVEFNLDRQNGADGTKITSPGNSFTMGIAPKIDLAVVYAYDFTKTEDGTKSRGMGPVAATLKTAFIEGKDRLPTFGIKAGCSLPTADGEQVALLATAIAQWSFEPITVFANVEADVGTRLAGNAEKNSSVRAGVAGSYEIRKDSSLLSELLWEKPTSPSAPSTSEWMIGAKKEITETLNVNGGIRWGLNRDSPHVAYLIGFTLGFRGEPSAQAAAAKAGDRK